MLQGKSILVTGAASGIGREAASLFADYGARLTLVDRDAEGLAQAAAGLGAAAVAVPADVTDPDAMREAVRTAEAAFGALHGAFNNAGVDPAGAMMRPIADMDADDFSRVMAINARGVFVCLQAEIPALLAAGGGAIVNTSSVMGWLAAPGMGGYVASKHAVVGLTRTAALDYARQNIRVNAILPGAVATPMLLDRAFKANPGYAEVAAASHPMGRIGAPREIAEAAAWLLSDKASFVTGHTLAVDGGLSAC